MRNSSWIATVSLWLLAFPPIARAQSTLGGLQDAGNAAGFGREPQKLAPLIGQIVNAVLALSGLILVVLFVWGGILYLTAQGDVERVKKAKGALVNAVIGIVIVVSAFTIVSFFLPQLVFLSGS